MARGKDILPAAAAIEFRYNNVSDMPWSKIEEAAGKEFSSADRKEIHFCAQGFDWEFQFLSKAPPHLLVKKVRDALLKHCNALTSLGNAHPPKISDYDEGKLPDVASALEIYYGTDRFAFRDSYEIMVHAARHLAEGLAAQPQLELATLALTPETAGLKAFLERVLDGADAKEARSTSAGGFETQGYEYRRWGIAIGARASGFAPFAGAVLSRKVTKGMLRKAWPKTLWDVAS